MSAKTINKNVIWHSMNPNRVTPDEFVAVIEIPKGCKKKYELDKETGLIILDRVLRTATHYPCSYGLIPLTLSEDHDPLDVMVICSETLDPNTLVKCRPVGLIEMIDKGERDEKIIAVAVDDPYVNLDDYSIDKKCLKYISANDAKKYRIIPLFKIEDTLTVAMADPLDLFAIDKVIETAECSIEPVVSSEISIQNKINEYYQDDIIVGEISTDENSEN